MTNVASRPAPEPSGSGAGPEPEVESAREHVLGSSSLAAHLVLLAVWLGGTAFLAQEAINYNQRSRAFPLLTFAVMAALVLVRVAQVIVGARRYGAAGPSRERLFRETVMLGWLAAAWVLVLLFGLIPGSIAMLAAYLAVHRPTGLVRSVITVVGVYVAVRILFVEVLNLPMQSGLLF